MQRQGLDTAAVQFLFDDDLKNVSDFIVWLTQCERVTSTDGSSVWLDALRVQEVLCGKRQKLRLKSPEKRCIEVGENDEGLWTFEYEMW